MPATRDGKLWRSQFYYKDWQGVRRKKNKRGFKTKGEADEWERNFLQQQQKNLDINFENFVEMVLSILVDTFSSRISLTMPPSPKPHNTACVLS